MLDEAPHGCRDRRDHRRDRGTRQVLDEALLKTLLPSATSTDGKEARLAHARARTRARTRTDRLTYAHMCARPHACG